MVDGFSKNGDTVSARLLFDRTPLEMRSVVPWTVMVDGYVSNGEMEAARTLFEQMPERNFFVWSSMISGYCKKGLMQEAKSIFHRISVRNLVNWNALISGIYSDTKITEKVVEEGSSLAHNQRADDDAHYVILSNIYAASDRWENAEKMRMIMAKCGIQKTAGRSSIMLVEHHSSSLV
ncbi:hypothetical protein MKX01_037868 [Papaver californicum]|nr:hypothetical protein MKX01_037868 [Papaver californicum]